MAFRVVMIENEVSMKLKLNNLVLDKEGQEIWIPLSDISVVVIDNLRISITTRMLSMFADKGIGVIVCNMEHLPIGFYSAYDNHSRASKVIKSQISYLREDYDYLWSNIIKSKIKNQYKVLEKLNKSKDVIEAMKEYENSVELGDLGNREAHAAKIYFNELMGTSFSRGNEDLLMNSGLDYGYAIIRSYLARMCVSYGLNTSIGIHHRSEYNRFNLVDDIFEPFRPIVDLYAYELLQGEEYFKSEHRHKLVNILNHKIKYKNKEMYISNALEEYVSNIASVITGNFKKVTFPDVLEYRGDKDGV